MAAIALGDIFVGINQNPLSGTVTDAYVSHIGADGTEKGVYTFTSVEHSWLRGLTTDGTSVYGICEEWDRVSPNETITVKLFKIAADGALTYPVTIFQGFYTPAGESTPAVTTDLFGTGNVNQAGGITWTEAGMLVVLFFVGDTAGNRRFFEIDTADWSYTGRSVVNTLPGFLTATIDDDHVLFLRAAHPYIQVYQVDLNTGTHTLLYQRAGSVDPGVPGEAYADGSFATLGTELVPSTGELLIGAYELDETVAGAFPQHQTIHAITDATGTPAWSALYEQNTHATPATETFEATGFRCSPDETTGYWLNQESVSSGTDHWHLMASPIDGSSATVDLWAFTASLPREAEVHNNLVVVKPLTAVAAPAARRRFGWVVS